jgi:hypothetical protein
MFGEIASHRNFVDIHEYGIVSVPGGESISHAAGNGG